MVSPEPTLAGDLSAAPTVVVTGAAGWLGQNLVRALAARPGAGPLPGARRPTRPPLLEVVEPAIEIVVGDVRDPAVIDGLFDGVGGAHGLPRRRGHPPRQAVREFFDVNVGGTQLVLDRARRAGARAVRARVVELAVRGEPHPHRPLRRGLAVRPVHGVRPVEARGRAARAARATTAATSTTVIVRPPWFYGPFQPDRQTQFLAGGAARPVPARRRRHAAALDGLHGQPRAGAAARRGGARGRGPGVLDRRRRAVRAAHRPRDRPRRARGRGLRGHPAASRASRGVRRAWSPRGSTAWRRARGATCRRCTCSAS